MTYPAQACALRAIHMGAPYLVAHVMLLLRTIGCNLPRGLGTSAIMMFYSFRSLTNIVRDGSSGGIGWKKARPIGRIPLEGASAKLCSVWTYSIVR